jgi:drug/metabolite transporter (DMT)-like permease
VGFLLYIEALTPNKIIGILIVLVGLYFINKS